ncbi:MAG: hypothetical protein LBM93_02900 [Oscillospiraceae bacterium]|nr:hypothetical protein [Oscillospiraceae bacterium]
MEKITINARTDIPYISSLQSPKIIFILNSANEKDKAEHTIIREHLLKRHSTFQIEMPISVLNKYGVSISDLPFALIRLAFTEKVPFVNNDFDYLHRSVRQISYEILYDTQKIKISYNIKYLTTSAQEDEIENVLHEIFTKSKIYSEKAKYKRIKFAYDYIISNVTYDKSFARYSAYDALIKKSAVCEGCANLFYRMLSMLSVPCRIITGRGMNENHAWNLVRLGNVWYNADVTWDLYKNPVQRALTLYDYFLKNESDFRKHTRDAEFSTADFKTKHPMSKTNYSKGSEL